jgi:glycosyltransferase involved in cell wall biosynthesis
LYPGKTTALKKIIFTVTNDLTYDQRMIRICGTLAKNGYAVLLVGIQKKSSVPLKDTCFGQKRLPCFFEKGKLFYIEYNLRLCWFLLFQQMNCICAIDLDTIVPALLVSHVKKIPRVYDAHELFCEMKEIIQRPVIHRLWKMIERFCVPKFRHGYTVNQEIANEFNKLYGVTYAVVRNVPLLQQTSTIDGPSQRYIIYQGAVNEGRCFEMLIPAMQWVDAPLFIYGDGNFMQQAQELVSRYQVQQKVCFKGKLPPDELRARTQQACFGITLFDTIGHNSYYSLANRFFDYMQAGIPQLCVDFPVYRQINRQHEVALLTANLSPENLAEKMNLLLNNTVLYKALQNNCSVARLIYNWQQEEKILLNWYQQILQ